MADLYVACENTYILDLRSVIHEVTTSHQPVFDLAWRRTGSTFVYILLVRSGEECSNNFCVTAMDTNTQIWNDRYQVKGLGVAFLLNEVMWRGYEFRCN